MQPHVSLAGRGAARALMALLAALSMTVPLLAGAGETPEEQEKAAKVAKKVEKAVQKARKAQEEPAEADRRALRKFHEDVMEYAALHARQLARLGKPAAVDVQGSLADHRALASSIQSKRATARQGDIFLPAVVPIFRRLIAAELRGPAGLPARQSVLEENPGDEEDGVPGVVRVNVEYPLGAARSTVPPSLLQTLPSLPACLRYRFVGRDLILVDCVAQLVVDVLPAAVPELVAR